MIRPTVIDEEYRFEHGLIISSTNLKGIITYANRKFCELSGYHRDELKGSNHNMVRHPDMPKAVFQDLWDTIRAGKEWAGIVKNLRKDGRYYWVHTYITPIFDNDGKAIGYSAARRPVTETEIHESTALYKEMLEKENN